jgi:carbamate kinase
MPGPVMRDFCTPQGRAIHRLTVDELADLHLPAGSMGPKVESCARFTRATGRPSAVGALPDAAAVLRGEAGTTVTPVLAYSSHRHGRSS